MVPKQRARRLLFARTYYGYVNERHGTNAGAFKANARLAALTRQ
jgi:hypothetical protein